MAYLYGFDGEEVSETEWAVLFRSSERFVKKTILEEHRIEISTVWIGIGWGVEEPPMIYETMAFPMAKDTGDTEWLEMGCWRWATREDAIEGHDRIVSGVVSGSLELRRYDDDEDLL